MARRLTAHVAPAPPVAQASGCNNPTLAAARCDAQCEACQPDGSCAPKAPTTDCLANGLQGKCSAGQCKVRPAACCFPPAAACLQPACRQRLCLLSPLAEPLLPTTLLQALPSPPSPPPPASQPPPQSPPPKASPPPQSPPPQSPPPKAQPPPQAPAQPPAQPPAPQEPAKTAAKPTAAAVQQPVQEPQPATGEQPAEAAANADAAGVAAAAAAAEEATVEGFVPFDFGVTATAGAGARYVVLTWAAGASWADQVLGYRLDIQQEGATPGQFLPAAGWERALVQTRLTPAYPALPPALKERTATTPAGTTTHYRLTVRIEEPTPGARVRVALQSVLGDGGQLSVPAVLTSAA